MPAAQRKVIITCAITGAIHTPTMTPYLPITAEQIAEEAVKATAAGAAILHLHAREPGDGRPSADPARFLEFLPEVRSRCDAVLGITTGGGQNMTVQERLAAAIAFEPELCSLNMGSMNFGLFPALARYQSFVHEWERPYLEGSRDYIFRNTFADIEYILQALGERTRFEFECYDVGHLYSLAHLLDRGLVRPPLFVQMIFGILGGTGADPENLLHMRRIAHSLFGDALEWSVLAAGRHQMAMATMAGICGGNVRVGLEDSIYVSKGRLAVSNAEQVAKIRRILEELSFEIATPAEARARLDLKGGDSVAF
ncbi:MAG: 3-keto-5-aminohexanoate cleavage protein [Acidobacteria bacterium]|nr:3-keto-5-aminohexanoate cleavage protein [Acidobacteriota bacterium]